MGCTPGVLRAARLPTDLRTKTEAGRSFIVLFDKVRPGSVEEHAAKVLGYAQALRHHLKNGDGHNAVWCALRMSQHNGWASSIKILLTISDGVAGNLRAWLKADVYDRLRVRRQKQLHLLIS